MDSNIPKVLHYGGCACIAGGLAMRALAPAACAVTGVGLACAGLVCMGAAFHLQ